MTAPTLTDLLRNRGEKGSHETTYRFLDAEDAGLTAARLLARAKAIAARLQAGGPVGARALLVFPAGPEFIEAFFGCALAGVIPVPAPLPGASGRGPRRLEAIARSAEPSLVMGTAWEARVAAELPGVPWLCPAEVADEEGADWRDPGVGPDDLAYLQYTSGSTAEPRGVMVRHAALLANLACCQRAWDYGPESRALTWVPNFHDDGLVHGLLLPLYAGFPTAILSPGSFVGDPIGWLRRISELRATHAGGPNFAYELVLRRAVGQDMSGLDLSAWRMAYNAAEPVRLDTLRRFHALLAPCGLRWETFRPSFGLAEATLLVSTGPMDQPTPSLRLSAAALAAHRVVAAKGGEAHRDLVGCGVPAPTVSIAIVHPERGHRLGPDEVGEIWVGGPSVSDGYWRQPEASAARFHAHLPGEEERWLRTGDLGFLHEGQLYVSGRIKDLIIVAGSNHYPQDLERTAEASSAALRPGNVAAFGVEGDGAERVVLVAEQSPSWVGDLDAEAARIRDAIGEAHSLPLHALVLLPRDGLPKTSSGKLQRGQARQAFLEGSWAPIRVWRWGAARDHRDLEVLTNSPPHPAECPARGHLLPQGEGESPEGAEPIAIIGVACRLPGADSPERFWRNVAAGEVSLREVPEARWRMWERWHAGVRNLPQLTVRRGGFLDDLEQFDPDAFGISAREAPSIDPQQRLLLELAVEALDDAGLPAESLSGGNTGVYIGALDNEYLRLQFSHPDSISAWSGTGGTMSVLANRLSYTFDWHGPSLACDTACSSTLTALHLAVAALRTGETDLALVGGVNLMLTPAITLSFIAAHVLSPGGQSRPFSDQADGYVRGEGAGIFVLKRLRDARAAGDRVHAIVLGTGLSQGGRTPGIMAPNPAAQEGALRAALADARVSPDEVSFIEAHGTSTPRGDPAEAAALGAVYGVGRDPGRPLWLGSAKAHIGHLEGAAGAAGLVKAIWTLKNATVYPIAGFERPNPEIPLASLGLGVPRAPTALPASRLIGGVSSFGFGGANAHVLLAREEREDDWLTTSPPHPPFGHLLPQGEGENAGQSQCFPPLPEGEGGSPLAGHSPRRVRGHGAGPPSCESAPAPLLISAHTEEALTARAAQMATAVRAARDADLSDLCWTAATRRAHHRWRIAATGADRKALAESLDASTPQAPVVPGPLLWLLSGHGGQHDQMAAQLEQPIFAEGFAQVREALSSALGRDPLASPAPDRVAWAQPAIFAMQVAMGLGLRRLGLVPDAIIGHSVGEVAAAVLAGALTVEEGARVVALRSALMARVEGRGALLAVSLGAGALRQRIAALDLCVAVDLDPRHAVAAGSPEAIDALAADLSAEGISCKRVATAVAFHSPQMDPLCAELAAGLADLSPRPVATPLYSTVTGGRVRGPELGPAHWVGNLRQPARLREALEAALGGRNRADILELGPRPTLGGPAREALAERAGLVLAATGRDAARSANEALARLYETGRDLRWDLLFPRGRRLVDLPPYPWQRRRHWLDTVGTGATPGHGLLGKADRLRPGETRRWTFDLHTQPWLRDHRVGGRVLLPGAALLELARAAGEEALALDGVELRDTQFRLPLSPPDTGPWTAILSVEAEAVGGRWSIAVEPDGAPYAVGLICAATVPAQPEPLDAIRARCAPREVGGFYERHLARGLDYGPAFRGVSALLAGEDEALATLSAPEAVGRTLAGFGAHPALLDAAFQAMAAMEGVALRPYVPTGVARLRLHRPLPASLLAHVRRRPASGDALRCDLDLRAPDGSMLAEVEGLTLRAPRREADTYTLDWVPAPSTEASLQGPQPDVVMDLRPIEISDPEGVAQALMSVLETARGLPQGRLVVVVEDALYQAPVAGLLRTLRLERPELRTRLIEATNASPEGLAAAMRSYGDEDELRVEGEAISVRRLRLVRPPKNGILLTTFPPHPPFGHLLPQGEGENKGPFPSENGEALSLPLLPEGEGAPPGADEGESRSTRRNLFGRVPVAHPHAEVDLSGDALITGGGGGLGLRFAEFLIRSGARRVTLLGRHAPEGPAVDALRRLGAEILPLAVDIADGDALVEAVTRLPAPPRVIIHAAGVVEDAGTQTLDRERLARVLAPKLGAWNLHRLGLELDAFVLCSSAAGLLGSPGQAAYGAGNAFLDALATYRRARGLPAVSVAWGPFAEVGMAARGGRLDAMAREGMGALDPDDAVAMLPRLAASPEPVVAALSLDLERLGRSRYGALPALRDLLGSRVDEVGPEATVLDVLTGLVAAIFRVGEAAVRRARTLADLGLDSITTGELRGRIHQRYGLDLPLAELLAGPPLSALAARIEAALAAQDVANLADDEVNRMLLALLQESESLGDLP